MRFVRDTGSELPAVPGTLLRSVGPLLALILFASLARAQDLTVHAPPQSGPIAIVGATFHPVSGGDIDSGYIVFDKGRITDIGSGKHRFARGTEVIDATGLHVYPGLIGAVTRIGLTEISAVRAMRDYDEVGAITPEVRAAVAVNPDSTLIPVARTAGILTVGVFPTGGVIPGRASVIRMDGWTWEDMTIRDSAGLVLNWPNVRPITAWWMRKSEEEQRKDIRRSLDRIDDAFDSAQAYDAARAADPDLPIDLRWEAMHAVFSASPPSSGGAGIPPASSSSPSSSQLPIFINANDVDQITAAVSWAIKRGLKPVIVGGRDAPLAADLLKRHDVPVIISGTHNMPKRSDSDYDQPFRLPATLESLGIRWCLASGQEAAHERNLRHNAGTAVAFGLSPEAAIRSITLAPARILGIAGDLGSLETGKSATLIITDGSPLEITTRVRRAFIDGRDIDLSNKQTRLRDKYRLKYRQLDRADN